MAKRQPPRIFPPDEGEPNPKQQANGGIFRRAGEPEIKRDPEREQARQALEAAVQSAASRRQSRVKSQYREKSASLEQKVKKNESIERESKERPPRRRGLFGALRALTGIILRYTIMTALICGVIGYTGYKALDHFISGREVQAPDVRGTTLDLALRTLKNAELTLELKDEENNGEYAAGRILRQSPRPGAIVKSQTPVRVTLSLGPAMPELPDVTGLRPVDAEIKLRGAGFEAGERTWMHDASTPRGVVIGQDPPAGSRMPEDSRAQLLISLGPPIAEYSMPDLRGETLERAQELMERLRIESVEVRRAVREGRPEGLIADQEPQPGETLQPDTPVILTVALRSGQY
ncbi:PASTA domain-containing protein [Candidatus Sumerlaeota bacterium]|nr:PASTA domain-containing protein [Candidatus Sumerlaeota bacterium]